MKIQVLGSGCPTCKKLFELTCKAVEEMGFDTEPVYVAGAEGMKKIVELGAMQSPVITVDDQIAMTGFTSDVKKIKQDIENIINKSS